MLFSSYFIGSHSGCVSYPCDVFFDLSGWISGVTAGISFSGDPLYEEKAFNVSKHLHSLPKENQLVPMFISTDTGHFGNDQTITLGARADSYYEYLLKQWIQTGMKVDFLKEDYLRAMEAVREHLTRRSTPNSLLFVGELKNRKFSPKMVLAQSV